MDALLHDPTSWIYIISMIISFYGAVLFFWWWAKQGKASSVFAYVTFIFIGEFLESLMSAYARFLRLEPDQLSYADFINGFFWPGRKTITVIALGAIVVHMSYRAFFGKIRRDD